METEDEDENNIFFDDTDEDQAEVPHQTNQLFIKEVKSLYVHTDKKSNQECRTN